jgi:hypothetical protein
VAGRLGDSALAVQRGHLSGVVAVPRDRVGRYGGLVLGVSLPLLRRLLADLGIAVTSLWT